MHNSSIVSIYTTQILLIELFRSQMRNYAKQILIYIRNIHTDRDKLYYLIIVSADITRNRYIVSFPLCIARCGQDNAEGYMPDIGESFSLLPHWIYIYSVCIYIYTEPSSLRSLARESERD